MKNWQHKVENKLYNFGHIVYKYAYIFILISLAFVIVLATNLKKLTMDTSIEGFLHTDDKALIEYEKFKAQFGKDEKIVVTLQTKDSIFTQQNLYILKSLHNELSTSVPYLDKVDSLVNIRDTKGNKDTLIVEDFLQNMPKTPTQIDEYKNRASNKYLYQNMIISKDTKFANIIITLDVYKKEKVANDDLLAGFEDTPKVEIKRELLGDKEEIEAIKKIKDIVTSYQSDDIKLHLVGSPVVTQYLKLMLQQDIQKFVKIIILVILVLLFILFRRVFAVVLPLLTIILSVVATISLMALFGVPIKMPTQILPSFLLAVGIGASVHFLAIFIKEFNKTNDKREAIAYTFRHSSLAIIMTSITTASGLISFYFSDILPISDLGIFASIGVMIALVFTLTLLPALLAVFPIKPKDMTNNRFENQINSFLIKMSDFSVDRAKEIVIISTLLVAISLFLASKLEFSHNVLKWLPKDYDVRSSTQMIDKELNGTVTIEMIIDTQKSNGLYDYELLKNIEALQEYGMSIHTDDYYVGKAWSVIEVLKETNMALNENKKEFYKIPDNKELIAQELFLFENSGSDDLEDLVDSDFSKARVTFKVPWIDAVKYQNLIDTLNSKSQELFKDYVKVTITGIVPIFNETITKSIVSSAKSYIFAFGIIAILMIILISDIKLGLISMIPNISPIIIALSIMYIYNIPLDMFTMLIGSIAIGIAVDDTIHFMHNFKKYYQNSGDVKQSIEKTFLGAGRAMFVTSVVLSLGFLVYVMANMSNLVNFGIITAIVIIFALLADFLLAPALMALFADKLIGVKK